MNNDGIKLFNYQGTPVILKWWFFLSFLFFDPITVSIIFFSVLLHELGHSYVANKLGYKVNEIVVSLLYGYASIPMTNIHERDSIKIVLGGPIVNLILFLISGVPLFFGFTDKFSIIESIYMINGIIFISNMLPIYPTDGGRIFRDVMMIKNRTTGVEVSSIVSFTFCMIVLIAGIVYGYWIASIFAGYFGYLALKELNYFK